MFFFFFNDTATTEIYTLSLHDALPISGYTPMRSLPTSPDSARRLLSGRRIGFELLTVGSGEAALEQIDRKSTRLNSSHLVNLVCRLLLEKKKKENKPSEYEF